MVMPDVPLRSKELVAVIAVPLKTIFLIAAQLITEPAPINRAAVVLVPLPVNKIPELKAVPFAENAPVTVWVVPELKTKFTGPVAVNVPNVLLPPIVTESPVLPESETVREP